MMEDCQKAVSPDMATLLPSHPLPFLGGSDLPTGPARWGSQKQTAAVSREAHSLGPPNTPSDQQGLKSQGICSHETLELTIESPLLSPLTPPSSSDPRMGMVVHTINPSIQDDYYELRIAWFAVSSRPG